MNRPVREAPRAELLSIGSELLLGETVDTNAAFLAGELATLGLAASETRAVRDDRAIIAGAFEAALARSGLVVATGGLGPTHDDLTREGLSDALGELLAEDPDLRAGLEERFRAYGRMPSSNLRQAMRIPSAAALPNPIGSAPGWWVERDGHVVVLLPGVPSEMRLMWDEHVRPRLRSRFEARPLAIRTVKGFGIGESTVAERLATLLEAPPEGVDTGIYARDDGIHVRFSTAGDASGLDRCVAQALAGLGADAYGTDNATLAEVALRRLGEMGVALLATSESGSGGSLLTVLSAVEPTSGSARFAGGVLLAESASAPPAADAVLELTLLPQDANGRSRVRVSLTGAVTLAGEEVRIHGSGPQRMRRAAFAALDLVRRL